MGIEAQQKFIFKKDLKEEFLAGRTVKRIAERAYVSYVYLSDILNGKKSCSFIYAKNLWQCANDFRPFEYYFKKEE